MENLIPVINDLSVIAFDLLIFTKMISLKRETSLSRMVMYLGCFLIIVAYFTAAYILKWPAALSSVICMSIPSLILFFCLSKHKDSRFFMTFCFVDSVSLMIAFLGRYVGIITSQAVTVLSILVTIALFSAIVYFGRNYFKRYHELLEVTNTGWREMAVSLALIYFALVFFSAYPKPMIERVEYAPIYLVFSAVVVSCYVVFTKSIIKTRQIYEQNKRLEYEKQIFQIAYRDGLTGLGNRAAYLERVNRLERERTKGNAIGCLMFDLNDLKHINDTLGHHAGDRALCGAARALGRVFAREGSYLFRLGGDEFCVVMTDAVQEKIAAGPGTGTTDGPAKKAAPGQGAGTAGSPAKKEAAGPEDCLEKEISAGLKRLKEELMAESREAGYSITLAAGREVIRSGGPDTIEAAFMRADRRMYEDKRRQKSGRAE